MESIGGSNLDFFEKGFHIINLCFLFIYFFVDFLFDKSSLSFTYIRGGFGFIFPNAQTYAIKHNF